MILEAVAMIFSIGAGNVSLVWGYLTINLSELWEFNMTIYGKKQFQRGGTYQ
jgi:hypothetical protein